MGYYSEVALVLKKEANGKLLQAIKSESEYVQELIEKWPERHEVNEKTGEILYSWNSIKWYGDECEFLNNFLKELDSEDYRFMRLGEEYGDIDEHGQFYDCAFNLIATSAIEI